MRGVRHRNRDATCPLSGVQHGMRNGGITLVCTDCGGATEMPCPYCDYVHVPNKSGVGLSLHIISKHPEHTVSVPFEQALQEATSHEA